MIAFSAYLFLAVALFVGGLLGGTRQASLHSQLIALVVSGTGVFLFLIAWGSRNGPDPVAQALVLTGIVVALSSLGLGLALARRIDHEIARSQLDPDSPE